MKADDPGTDCAADSREALIRRLHRVQGQVRGVERMVQEDRCCIEILTQIAAACTALDAVARKVLDEHVRRQANQALASQSEAEVLASTTAILEAVERFAKTH